MRVIVTGGRSYTGDVSNVLDALDPFPTLIIHAGSSGAAASADRWAMLANVKRQPFYSNWKLGPSGYRIQHTKMIAEGKPDLVVAFPGGKQTTDMVRQAKAAGIDVLDADAMDARSDG